jgi:PTH1 family peptidyl-tRNA hydrolase
MYLIVGLGNPGKKYEQTRHNIGFMAVDAILNSYGSDDKPKKKFNSVIHELQLENKKVIIAKPETYMNNSGDAIIQIVNYFKIKTENILILHDELDLPFGSIRLKVGGGIAGHNGLKSILSHLDNTFLRLRLGIDHPGDRRLVSNYVLGNFNNSEMDSLNTLFDYIATNIINIISKREKFQINFRSIDNHKDKSSHREIKTSSPLTKILNIFK